MEKSKLKNKYYLYWGVALLIFIVFVILCFAFGWFEKNVFFAPDCVDSDTGLDYYVRGSVYGLLSTSLENYTGRIDDICNGPYLLLERYCCSIDNKLMICTKGYNCSYGCLNGACLPAPTTNQTNQTNQTSQTNQTGELFVNSEPSVAFVFIDEIYRGATPLNASGFSIGNYTLQVLKDGYENYTDEIFIGSGSNSINLTLTAVENQTNNTQINFDGNNSEENLTTNNTQINFDGNNSEENLTINDTQNNLTDINNTIQQTGSGNSGGGGGGGSGGSGTKGTNNTNNSQINNLTGGSGNIQEDNVVVTDDENQTQTDEAETSKISAFVYVIGAIVVLIIGVIVFLKIKAGAGKSS